MDLENKLEDQEDFDGPYLRLSPCRVEEIGDEEDAIPQSPTSEPRFPQAEIGEDQESGSEEEEGEDRSRSRSPDRSRSPTQSRPRSEEARGERRTHGGERSPERALSMDTREAGVTTESGNQEVEVPGEGNDTGLVAGLDPGTEARTSTEVEGSGTKEERARRSRRQGGNPPEVVSENSSRTKSSKRKRGEGGKAQS